MDGKKLRTQDLDLLLWPAMAKGTSVLNIQICETLCQVYHMVLYGRFINLKSQI